MKKTILLLLSFCLSLQVFATIRIVSTTAATGSCTGSIRVEATGTAGPFTITLIKSDGTQIPFSSPFTGTKTLPNLCHGTYTVKVFNRFECAAELSATVGKQLSIKDTILYNCDANGSIVITPSGGDAPYTYVWVGPGSLYVPPQNPVSVSRSGTYSITVTDSKGLRASKSISYVPLVSQAVPGSAQISIQASCSSGQGGGSICINVDTSKWKIDWPALGKTGACVNNINAGTHCYKLTDRGCNKVTNQCVIVPIGTPKALSIVSDTSRDCSVPQEKTICVKASGGLGPFQYTWSNGSTSACMTRSSSSRTVTITDVCNTTTTQSYNFGATFPALRIVSAEGINQCAHPSEQFLIKASGGKGPYTYEWFVGNLSNTVYSLVAGDINNPLSPVIPSQGNVGSPKVRVKDACGNSIEKILTSNRLGGETISFEALNNISYDCDVIKNIGVSFASSSNNNSLSYLWNTGASTSQISATQAGNYTLTITSRQNSTGKTCREVYNTSIPADFVAPFFQVSYVVTPASNGSNNGKIDLSVFGGVRPMIFSWGPGGPTTEDRSNLAAGTYTVAVLNNSWPYCEKNISIQVPTLAANFGGAEDLGVFSAKPQSITSTAMGRFLSKVYPNPFEKTFKLEIDSSLPGNSDIVVYNTLGQVVLKQQAMLVSGLNVLELDLGTAQNQQVFYVFVRHKSGQTNYHKIIQAQR
ncbi:T9SS type A sorting domain-containing protein [Haliscomenobacter sp.]|uniref:T9SS type A sorting domain-containing protein n=1 Tax=Haliscomenobacter sp. TaxID=2717303 RepID=UPI00359448AC